ncbi:hypothetical protein GQF61_08970 [Sphingobacterium sp. DK4209]|uniref:Uncharacterized protein n=1 Tax=Sphingobacterium zhuxiongii TaxID=2662364 RepID=A0A5Q0QE63_9SPHI|nr:MULTISPECIES: hypothetical protein [unclassified Sphingobacterium]MVZ65989.1 hypothetical protein [Sphingobacterium sp. DK4209]QGA27554.1 hypothetical protein GFH32_15065 [Sphingobacterium sp. dk4302]
MTSKNHTISKIVAKAILRIVMIILIIGIAYSFSKDANLLKNISLYFPHKWAIFAPISLFIVFIILMLMMLREKYKRTDFNWLFALAGGFLVIYLMMLFSRIYPLL